MALKCWRWAAPVLLLLLAVPHAHGLHADEANTFSWQQQLVGEAHAMACVPAKGRLVVASAANLIAGLSTKDGSIAWRRTFTDADPLGKLLVLPNPALAVTASRGGRYVRAWDAQQGALKWEAVVEGAGHGSSGATGLHLLPVAVTGAPAVAAVSAGSLQVLDAAEGGTIWRAQLDATGAEDGALLLAKDADTLHVAAYSAGTSQLHVSSFAVADGTPIGSTSLTGTVALGARAATSGAALAVMSRDGRSLCTAQLSGNGVLACKPLDRLLPEAAASIARVSVQAAAPGFFTAVSPTTGVLLLSAASDGPRTVAHWKDATAASPAAHIMSSGAQQLAIIVPDASGMGVTVELVDAATGAAVQTLTASLPAVTDKAVPHTAFLCLPGSPLKAATALTAEPRVALAWDDAALTMVTDQGQAWRREEALASITASLFVDLPAAAPSAAAGLAREGGIAAASAMAVNGRLKAWLRMQLLSVLVQFQLASPQEQGELTALRQALSTKNLPTRDPNRLRQLILVLTAPGKLYALHNGDGRVLWARSFGRAAPPQQLLQWRRFHDLTHAPQVAALRLGPAGEAFVAVLNAHTGEELERVQLRTGVQQIVPLHVPLLDGASEQDVYLAVGPPQTAGAATAPNVQLVPDSAAAAAAFASQAHTVYFWQQEMAGAGAGAAGAAGPVLVGYGFRGAVASSLVQVWRLPLPAPLLAVAVRSHDDVLHSAIKVLGDRRMLFKYVNPNTLFLATGWDHQAAGPHDGVGDGRDSPSVTAYLIDTVTGAMLHRQRHEGAAAPVLAIASEHWVVYTLHNTANARQQAVALEMYDATPRDASLAAAVLRGSAGAARDSAISSYTAAPLRVLSQSFWLGMRVKALAVTQTLQGITTKQLLMGTETDQVYALDKRFADPRRPLRPKATPAEAEERLVPYSDTLPFLPLAFASHDRVVSQLRRISAVRAGLESVCLLFATGVDLLFSRVTPARHFDSLEPDFSYGLLVLGLGVLAAATAVMRAVSGKAALKAKWQ